MLSVGIGRRGTGRPLNPKRVEFQRTPAQLAEQLAQRNFGEQAKGILKRLLAGQRPGIDDLARESACCDGPVLIHAKTKLAAMAAR
jgi:hypothetical protein